MVCIFRVKKNRNDMRKIDYPSPLHKFKKEYLAIFKKELPALQKKWDKLRTENSFLRTHLPRRISKIILADYSKLAAYYILYEKHSTLDDAQQKELKEIYNYESHQSKIAKFFMDKAKELSISTCFYCESAFINVYTVDDTAKNLDLLNTSSDEDLKKLLDTKSDETLNYMKSGRPYKSISSFNKTWENNRKGNTDKKFESIFPSNLRNHFDLDHVLDKGSCPLIALSLMNFVPSCQVCNEKLKISQILGESYPIEFLSPTSPNYNFYGNVTIRVAQSISGDDSKEALDPAYATDYPDNYCLKFDCHIKEYETIVKIFRLQERYAFHKMEGLHWIVMKAKYTDRNIQMMADTFKSPIFSAHRIKEDLFHKEYDNRRHPCFSKLKQDMLM